MGEAQQIARRTHLQQNWFGTIAQIDRSLNELDNQRPALHSTSVKTLSTLPLDEVQAVISKETNLSFQAAHSRLSSQVDSLYYRGILELVQFQHLQEDLQKADEAHVLAMRQLRGEDPENLGKGLDLSREALQILLDVHRQIDDTKSRMLNQVRNLPTSFS